MAQTDCDGSWKLHSGPGLSSLLPQVTGARVLSFPVRRLCDVIVRLAPRAELSTSENATSIDSLSSEAERSQKPSCLQTTGVGPLGQGSKDGVEQREAFTALSRMALFTGDRQLEYLRTACAHPLFPSLMSGTKDV